MYVCVYICTVLHIKCTYMFMHKHIDTLEPSYITYYVWIIIGYGSSCITDA